jgi:hypothetical protein
MNMKNPFPGMNPWLEDYWRDIHASLLVYARDELGGQLPPGLHARVDERLGISVGDEKRREYLPDVAITEPWDQPAGPGSSKGGFAVQVAEPQIVELSEVILRRLEIVDSREHVITVMEVHSPTNKDSFEGRSEWCRKREDYLSGGINLVELDLLRRGGWVLPNRWMIEPLPPPDRVYYHACVTRPPRVNRHEFYTTPLRQRLPAIRFPLRRSDADVALDLQSLVDQCFERGHYATQIRYDKPLHPPLPVEEAAWAREILGAGGVKGPS